MNNSDIISKTDNGVAVRTSTKSPDLPDVSASSNAVQYMQQTALQQAAMLGIANESDINLVDAGPGNEQEIDTSFLKYVSHQSGKKLWSQVSRVRDPLHYVINKAREEGALFGPTHEVTFTFHTRPKSFTQYHLSKHFFNTEFIYISIC